ncbi:MAG TPA: mechanosensitive ion channel family protein [Burkholderiales bacterium]|nr:mechanosensitive ion channel family protein [Burkholderiales bacterium]
MEPNLAVLDQVKSMAIDLGMKFGPKLLVAIIIMVAGYYAARWVAGMTGRALRSLEFEPPVRELMLSIVRVLVLLLFAIMALQNLGVELLPLIAGVGVAGAGIALAMQGVLGNLVAGLTIILTRPFRVGEYISIVGEEGQVAEIRLFSTTLSHLDLSRVVIPNRKIVGEILHNYGRVRQLQIEVGVAYDTDLSQALSTVREVLQANPRVLENPAPVIHVSQLADSSVTIAIRPWTSTADYGSSASEIRKALVEAFRARGIVIPFPQREVRLLEGTAGFAERRAA